MSKLKKAVCNCIAKCIELLPDNSLHNLLIEILRKKELDFVLEHDNRLYTLIGQKNPVHKDKLIGYTSFFVLHTSEYASVLDLGCGTGVVAYELATKKDCLVHAVDLNNGIKWEHQNITYIKKNILDYDSDEKFDTVILSNVLEHIEDRIKFLKRIKMLTLCKKFLIRVPMKDRHWVVKLKEMNDVDSRLDPDHKIEYTYLGFLNEMLWAGLNVCSYEVRWGELYAVVK